MAELNPIGLPPVPATTPQNGDGLHGHTPPRWELQKEQPWHLQAAYFFATAEMDAKQVARAMGKEYGTILNLLKQKWFQERVTKLMAENGGKDVMALFKAETLNSLVTLVEIRDDDKAPKAVRVQSAKDILDRALGKAKQSIEVSDGTPKSDDPVAEERRLREENERFQRSFQ